MEEALKFQKVALRNVMQPLKGSQKLESSLHWKNFIVGLELYKNSIILN